MLPDALYAPSGVVVDRAEVRDPREVLNMPEVYCVKCKAKREAIDTKKVTMKNGKPTLSGICEKCGTHLCAAKVEREHRCVGGRLCH